MRDEGSAVAGSTNYTLICTIKLPNDAMPTVEWTLPSSSLIVDETGSNGDNIYYTRLPLSPLTHEDEGNYTCSAYYTVGGVRSPTMRRDYHVTVRTPDATDDKSMTVHVALMGSGSGEVGSLYILTCTVTLSHRASDSSVSIQWQGPGLSHTDDDDDSTDNRVVVSELSLNPLTLAHGGDYTCTAEYTVDGEATIGSGNITLNVLSKLLFI